jgi:hypothetical protein
MKKNADEAPEIKAEPGETVFYRVKDVADVYNVCVNTVYFTSVPFMDTVFIAVKYYIAHNYKIYNVKSGTKVMKNIV